MLSTSPLSSQEDLAQDSETQSVLPATRTGTCHITVTNASAQSATEPDTMRVGVIPTQGNLETPQPRVCDYMD